MPTKTIEYNDLLEANHKEQVYQDWIEKNSEFVPAVWLMNHGFHYDLVIRKQRISSDYVSDFFYMAKSSDEWHYVFVEIEKPSCRFFKSGSSDYTKDFLHAIEQVESWQSWFENEANKLHFENQMSFLKRPLSNNKVSMKYILVYGRRSEFAENQTLTEKIRIKERSGDLKIITFDSLAENNYGKYPLYVGINKTNYIEILNNDLASPEFLKWINPNDIRIKQTLKDQALAHFRKPTALGPLLSIVKEQNEKIAAKIETIIVS